MKKQIRQGIFETNSSSSHSLQIVPSDQVQNIVFVQLIELIANSNYIEDSYEDRSITEDTLILTGFELESGDESSYVAQIIKSPICKIQYIFNVLCNKVFGWKEISAEKLEQTEEYKWFKSKVLDFLSKEYPGITKINIGSTQELYIPEYDKDFGMSDFNSEEEFNKAFDKVMSKDFCILLTDTPYSMWEAPKILIY